MGQVIEKPAPDIGGIEGFAGNLKQVGLSFDDLLALGEDVMRDMDQQTLRDELTAQGKEEARTMARDELINLARTELPAFVIGLVMDLSIGDHVTDTLAPVQTAEVTGSDRNGVAYTGNVIVADATQIDLTGGGGDDILVDGDGDAVLTGGAWSDVFVMARGQRHGLRRRGRGSRGL